MWKTERTSIKTKLSRGLDDKKVQQLKYSFILDYDLAVSMPETFVSRLVDLVEHLDDGLVLVVRGDGEHPPHQDQAGAEES